ncbi:UDP-N-acetylmuramoyl-tripeptide--D-alanyl-D-alanine ligase [Winogradskyella poriferorum]|uniref:UDP-N-acetylmuramoyl-tripeptide--D-alanyl-D- alanine ligase n=1 Tax=Winogradskyella poriferorum TaxID=307627 RepID=UPI003D65FEF3
MEIEAIYSKFLEANNLTTDTRKLSEGSMYVALKGENFDGNRFVKDAFEKGAKYCIVDDPNACINSNCMLVKNSLETLQALARHHRHQFQFPIIGLTGSNGKTTTKELIYAVLSTTYKVKATKGNLNNHIGVPLTLLEFPLDLDFGIVEMGANHQKEIEFLSHISQPDYGLITNFGKAHLEGFGGVEGVIKGKSELYDFVRSNNKTAFINGDDPKQIKQIGTYSNTVVFGSNEENDCVIEFIDAKPFVKIRYNNTEINSQLIGTYNFGNIAVATAIGHHFKISTDNIKAGIENYVPENNRSQIIKKGSLEIILDAYNANPSSMLGALTNFRQIESDTKYLFLGDMFELGDEAIVEHQNIIDFAEQNFSKNIFLIGENFYRSKTKPTTQKFKTFQDLIPQLKSHHIENATLLIKGSRGMALERILEFIN